MEHRRLGNAGITLSTIGLGTRTWGLDTDAHECAEILTTYLEAGGDTLDIELDPAYPENLETLAWLFEGSDFAREDLRLIVRSGNFEGFGPTRSTLLADTAAVLDALHTDYLDVVVAKGPRQIVPISETLTAMRTLYTSGRARYLAVGEFSWWDGGAITVSAQQQSTPLSGWSGELSLVRPVLAAAPGDQLRDASLGIIAGAPLALGILTGKYRHSTPADSRATTPRFAPGIRARLTPRTHAVVDALVRAAEGLDKSPTQVALAWTLGVPGVSCAVVGPRTVAQLRHILETAQWHLPPTLHDALSEVALTRD